VTARVDAAMSKASDLASSRTDRSAPLVIQQIEAFRSAARWLITESDLTIEEQADAIMRLHKTAKTAEIPWMVHEALLAEWRPQEPGEVVPPREREAAVRRLRASGYGRCPTCVADLPLEMEFEHWARLRRWRAQDEERLRGAAR
jgi:hypothetical protein